MATEISISGSKIEYNIWLFLQSSSFHEQKFVELSH